MGGGGRGAQRTAAPSHPPPWQASKFSTNWGWSADLKTGLATLGQGLAKTKLHQPTQAAPQCKDPATAELPAQAVAKQGKKCNCWLQIKPWIPSLFPF